MNLALGRYSRCGAHAFDVRGAGPLGYRAHDRPAQAAARQAAGAADDDMSKHREQRKEPVIEQIASFVWFFVLLLVFKGFFLPLFIIPTGSMAETLCGAHGTRRVSAPSRLPLDIFLHPALGEAGRGLLEAYERDQPQARLRTFRETERLWREVVWPELQHCRSMQPAWREGDVVPEDSVWYDNWAPPP